MENKGPVRHFLLYSIKTVNDFSIQSSCFCGPSLKSYQIIERNITLNAISLLLFFFFFSEPHLQHMEVPRLRVELELQLLTYAIATATPDLSCICDLCRSLWQCQMVNPLSEARDLNHILMETLPGS